MIKITPYFDDEPIELWENASQKGKGASAIEQAILSKGKKHKFDNKIYGSKTAKEKLKEIFNKKCAFCETNTHAGAHKDVEHYRYKSLYYWLGYEWTNLLLACQICNRDFKKTQFPLVNTVLICPIKM
jgi:hypothetical protein